jgi:hypothetical protein
MMRWAALVSMALWCAPAFAADYDVSATGRCVYVENGVRKPVPGARVELRDQDWDVPDLDVVGPVALDVSGNDVCGTAVAGADGRFSIRGRCGDFGPSFIGKTKPDLYVRCKVQGSGGRIFASSFPWTLYNTASRPRDDSAAPLAAGDVVLPAGPAKTFLALSETYAKIKSLTGASLLPVWVMYPGGCQAVIANTGKTYFASYAGTVFMSIAPGDEANGTVAHEYGHTLQFQSYLQDWSTINSVLNTLRAGWEAIRHPTGGGHTYSTKSNPVMAFAEGWAEFIECVVYGSGLPDCTRWKEIGANEADRIQVEGNIACRLFRLFKKWGFKDIWTAQTRSKAARYDHFFAEYKKIHPTRPRLPPQLRSFWPRPRSWRRRSFSSRWHPSRSGPRSRCRQRTPRSWPSRRRSERR